MRCVSGRKIIGLLLALCLFAGACSSSSDDSAESNDPTADSDQSEETSDGDADQAEPVNDVPSVPGAPLNRFDLQVGQCFNEGSWYDEALDRRVDLTASIDCNAEHQSEVYHEAEFPAPNGAPYPGDDTMTEWSTQICYDEFDDFVEADYEVSIFEIGFVQPTRETFEHPVGRHRRVFCYVYPIGGELHEGSAQGVSQ